MPTILCPSWADAAAVAREEALVTTCFRDRESWAIGFSHHGGDLHEGLRWTDDQSYAALRHDLWSVTTTLGRAIDVPLHPGQVGALVSLAYNVGGSTLAGGGAQHLPRHAIIDRINAGDCLGAAAQFDTFMNQPRRQREKALFKTGEHAATVNGLPLGQFFRFDGEPHGLGHVIPTVEQFRKDFASLPGTP